MGMSSFRNHYYLANTVALPQQLQIVFMEEILKHDFNGTTNECDVNATIFLHSRWIYQYFGDCVVEARQYIAFVIGTISIFCWLVAQLP